MRHASIERNEYAARALRRPDWSYVNIYFTIQFLQVLVEDSKTFLPTLWV